MAVAIAIMPVLIIGIILAILEIVFVHQDEGGMHPLAHALHAVPLMFIFIFISMNIGYVLGLVGMKDNTWIDIGVRVVIGIIAMIKIGAAAAVAGRVGEKLPHTIVIGVLVMASPFLWELVLCNIPFISSLWGSGCPALK
jgi:hypothetical protein